jgi:hypothetical protein
MMDHISVISYNVHGLNQGIPGIEHLIDLIMPDVFLIQEHWLTTDNLFKLNNISNDYFAFGSSAMDKCISAGPLYGRPYGGTAVLIHKKLSANVKCIHSSERFTIISCLNWLIICVYMPSANTNDRLLTYQDVLCELQGIIDANRHLDCLFAGDFNSDLSAASAESVMINNFITVNHLERCDQLFPLTEYFTYVNDALGHKSCIDYIFTSNNERTVAFNLLDIDINLSDHLPLLSVLSCDKSKPITVSKSKDILFRRWDHAPLELYYEHTRLLLEPVLCQVNYLIEQYVPFTDIRAAIDSVYNDLVVRLRDASDLHIPKFARNYFKFWWDEELDILKSNAMMSCKVWKAAGRPRQGELYRKYQCDKMQYKRRIREARTQETTAVTNDLHDALMRKSGRQFWSVWKSKFESQSNNAIQVDGSADSTVITDKFAHHFERICSPPSHTRNEEFKASYNRIKEHYTGGLITADQIFDVALLSNLVNGLKNGKAAGLDDLTAEHLKFSHPVVIVILAKLFNLFLAHGHIPPAFGLTFTVPIPKCNSVLKAMSTNDFRGISISPIISKLFEAAVSDKFCDYFSTSDSQFGFKKQLSCSHVIYSVRNVVDQYIAHGSTVNICSLDLSKAFDTMNHYVLLTKLARRNLPLALLNILELWFTISQTCVKWEGCFSHFFPLTAGVRQGGVLSPVLFAIFIDDLVDVVRRTNVGCYISHICCAIFLYADDILLLAPSITGLQLLLSACESYLRDIDMNINVNKSHCIRFGPRFNRACEKLTLSNGCMLEWTTSCKYLGVCLESSFVFRVSFDAVKCQFFRSFNAIYSKVGRIASEEVIVSLLSQKCIPILLYGTESCPILSRHKQSFEFSITKIFMKIFKTRSSLIVKHCQDASGFLTISKQIDYRTASFLKRYALTDNVICGVLATSAQEHLRRLAVSTEV